jgi:hypothetical protein
MSSDSRPLANPFAATVATINDPLLLGLDAHERFVVEARSLYAPNVEWLAPARGILCVGREPVICHLLREAGGMCDPEFTSLRRHRREQQIVDEFAVRFTYAGEGLDAAPIARDDFVELKRVRVMELRNQLCVKETCIETWTVLLPAASGGRHAG